MLHRVPSWLVPASALVLAGLVLPRPSSPGTDAGPSTSTAAAQKKLAAAAPAAPELPIRIGEISFDEASGRYVAPLGDRRATLTLDPGLQDRLERALDTYRVPWGATVLIEPATGRILALAEHSRAEPGRRGLSLAALAPAASIFKLVTAAALLEQGTLPDEEVCYHGGKHRLAPKLLADDPRRDHRCVTLASAFGHSTNVVFAKLADRGLDAGRLRATAERFLFNTEIPFAHPVEISKADIPDDDFGFANTAAGFGGVKLSPLHAALLAAIVANEGVLVPPVIVDAVEGGPVPSAGDPRRVIEEPVAAELARMMRSTVTEGTARRAFARARGPLRSIPVAGKTGSLADAQPYRDYSWFVGYAPADRPQVAIATVVVNERLWHARAPTVAREALEAYFASHVASAKGGELRTAAAR
ncbi:penicillin-binding transpeptidase domain-containing protein [Anaeromyxobacter terrae]|uniref:penicillin-binding transpeptidase domain-containing protein n=1 Tax=Anaeromyxobacter terrae TaxID=2925406 RepID=UPI001F57E865|nr:penicillin-binding transpeptidase domain-containing protein [Anaeromyxobacter sp. SG22]